MLTNSIGSFWFPLRSIVLDHTKPIFNIWKEKLVAIAGVASVMQSKAHAPYICQACAITDSLLSMSFVGGDMDEQTTNLDHFDLGNVGPRRGHGLLSKV